MTLNRTRFTQERLEGTLLDKVWVAVFLGLCVWLACPLALRIPDAGLLILLAVVSGWVGSDLVSGLVHWAGDTWGSTEVPVFGPRFIRPFREHHFDPKSITLHDFFDVNGTNCAIVLPLLAYGLIAGPSDADGLELYAITTAWSLAFWTFATNQVHKWAHRDVNPWWVRALQATWLILPPTEHEKHHAAPFSKYYCITTGWLNPLLARTGFFRGLEWLITRATGAIPRREEYQAARELFGGPSPG